MGRHAIFQELHPLERRVAFMRVAGADLRTIALVTEKDETSIREITLRPRVANFMMVCTGMIADELAPAVGNLNDSINEAATRAFEIENTVMERLFANDESVRAQMGAASTAQDILDRAGHRAPAKAITYNMHEIAPGSINQLARAISDVSNSNPRDITPTPRGYNNGERQGVPGNGTGPVEEDIPDGSSSVD